MPKAIKREPGKLPARYELSLGNKSTKYSDLTWPAACKVAATSGGNPLRVKATLYHAFVPPGESGQGIYGTYTDIPQPCEPRAISNALKRAKKMVEDGEASIADVTSQAEYVHGGSHQGHHAHWRHGGWERDDAGLAGARCSRARTKKRRRSQ